MWLEFEDMKRLVEERKEEKKVTQEAMEVSLWKLNCGIICSNINQFLRRVQSNEILHHCKSCLRRKH